MHSEHMSIPKTLCVSLGAILALKTNNQPTNGILKNGWIWFLARWFWPNSQPTNTIEVYWACHVFELSSTVLI